MTLLEAIEARHSVRAYKDQPLSAEAVEILSQKIAEVNALCELHIQLIQNEPKAFASPMAKYGRFRGVTSYLVMAGPKADDLDEKVGYFGEQIVLLAQTLGLNTCWVGVSYSKIPGTYVLNEGEKIACYISLGYGETQGASHRIKSVSDVSNADKSTPDWFMAGVQAALLAPTAVNQQKFYFEYLGNDASGKGLVRGKKGSSMLGYTLMDLGIAKCHFEIGAGQDNFLWTE